MDYKEIEKYASTDEGLVELLGIYQKEFDTVESIGKKLRSNVINDSSAFSETAGICAGLRTLLKIVADILDTCKTDKENRVNYAIVCELEKSGGKVVQAQIDKIVSMEVQSLRRVRNIFTTYAEHAQSNELNSLSRLKQEKYTPREGN